MIDSAENQAAIETLKTRPPRPPKTRIDWALQIVRDIAALTAVVALGIGLWNLSSERTSVMCQASLLQNFSAQSEATKQAVIAIQNAAQVQADTTAMQATDLGVMTDQAQSQEARSAAFADFRAQAQAQAQAWQTYVTARAAANEQAAANPVTFRC
jgi:hypothetical protein